MNQDEKYFSAIEAGDEDTICALLMTAAHTAGYLIGPVYHGTSAVENFTIFDGSKGWAENEFWFSDDREAVRSFVGSQSGRIIEAFLRIERPGAPMDLIAVRSGRASNFDGVIYSGSFSGAGSETGNAFVVFSPTQIKSARGIERDKFGEIIPLSQRFAESPDIRGDVSGGLLVGRSTAQCKSHDIGGQYVAR